MQKILFVLITLPLSGYAQLDRVRTNMTESEFIAVFPEAKRDLDAEAVWVSESETVNGVEGNSLWRIYNDTISEYRFNSTKAQGPSAQYPKFDSSAVHKMRVSADAVRMELQKAFGKPTSYTNIKFSSVGDETYPGSKAYLALWNFGPDDFIRIEVSTDLSTGNFINAPGKYTVVESESYELSVEVMHRSAYTMEKYSVGMEDDAFFKTHIGASTQVKAKRDHIYVIKDSLISENAEWKFTFAGGEVLMYFTYKAYLGTAYGDKSDESAYDKGKLKAEQLFKEGKTAFGEPAESTDKLTVKYVQHERNLTYHETLQHSMWSTKRGGVFLDYSESGGGKSPDTIFYVQVHFEFTP